MKKYFILALTILTLSHSFAQTPTLQDVTTAGNVTDSNIIANRMVGRGFVKSTLIIGTESTYKGNNSLNGETYIIGFRNAVDAGSYQTVVGSYNHISAGSSNTLVGKKNTASGTRGVALGWNNTVTGNQTVAVGIYNNAQAATHSVALGGGNQISGDNASAIGNKNKANGYKATAFGHQNTSYGSSTVSFGIESHAMADNAIAIGYRSMAKSQQTVAIGYQSTAKGLYSVSIGRLNFATQSGSIIIGANDTTNAVNAHAIGTNLVNNTSNSLMLGISHTAYIKVLSNGNVGIGTPNPQAKLSVDGTVYAKKVKVTLQAADWADYVFDSTYRLRSLQNVEGYIKANKHLPGVPSANTLSKEGVDLLQSQAILLEKIEELTLYTIALNKKLEQQQKEIIQLKHNTNKTHKK